jgi:hypothetical protein
MRRIGDAALDHALEHEGGIACGAAAGVVGAVGDDHGAAFESQRLVQRFIDGG